MVVVRQRFSSRGETTTDWCGPRCDASAMSQGIARAAHPRRHSWTCAVRPCAAITSLSRAVRRREGVAGPREQDPLLCSHIRGVRVPPRMPGASAAPLWGEALFGEHVACARAAGCARPAARVRAVRRRRRVFARAPIWYNLVPSASDRPGTGGWGDPAAPTEMVQSCTICERSPRSWTPRRSSGAE